MVNWRLQFQWFRRFPSQRGAVVSKNTLVAWIVSVRLALPSPYIQSLSQQSHILLTGWNCQLENLSITSICHVFIICHTGNIHIHMYVYLYKYIHTPFSWDTYRFSWNHHLQSYLFLENSSIGAALNPWLDDWRLGGLASTLPSASGHSEKGEASQGEDVPLKTPEMHRR